MFHINEQLNFFLFMSLPFSLYTPAPLHLYALMPFLSHPNGLSLKGLWNGESFPLLPPRGGGEGGMLVIITSETELSIMILTISGLEYFLFFFIII